MVDYWLAPVSCLTCTKWEQWLLVCVQTPPTPPSQTADYAEHSDNSIFSPTWTDQSNLAVEESADKLSAADWEGAHL